MVSRTQEFQVPDCPLSGRDEVYRVEQVKYDIDAAEPWWRRVLFRWAFLPFNRLSFKLGIPAVGAIEPETALCPSCGSDVPGNRLSWVEDQGTYTERHEAREALAGEFWRVRRSPLNASLPAASCEFACAEYPKGVQRYRHSRKMALMLKPVAEIKMEKEAIESLTEQADRIRLKMRTLSI